MKLVQSVSFYVCKIRQINVQKSDCSALNLGFNFNIYTRQGSQLFYGFTANNFMG
jgi:hypothetical protein